MDARLSFLLIAPLDEAVTGKDLLLDPSAVSLCIFLPLNREDTIFCEGGKSIAIDSKFNYLTKINYHVRTCSGRPKNDV
jgi:hypothetical protein